MDSSNPARIKDRGRIFLSGAIAAVAMIIAVGVILFPLNASRDDLAQISRDGVPLQGQILELRTAIVDWQFFIERHLDALRPGAPTDATELIKGADIVKQQTAHAATLTRGLARVGYASDARSLSAAMADFTKTLTSLVPIASGTFVGSTRLHAIVSTERAALEEVWALTTRIGRHITQDLTKNQAIQAEAHLDQTVWIFLACAIAALMVLIVVTLISGHRAGRRERDQRQTSRRHAYEGRVQQALEMTKTEPDVYDIVGEALRDSLPHLKVEMLIADSSRAHFRRALTNNDDFEGCSVGSPLACPAATVGHPLVFPSSRALDACPYLKNRLSGQVSATCIPVSIAGRTVGVTHAVGPDNTLPADVDIETLTFTSRRGSERIAMIRAFTTSEMQAQTDPLTGLLNRRSLENSVRDLRDTGTPYALAYGDLDHFKILNDTYGHEAGDQALRLFARVLGQSLRPADIAARYGGEEFVIVLPDCSTTTAISILERVRESLALALNGGHVPHFTVTFGLASSAYADEFNEVVAIADQALLGAKAAGRNRVALAEFPVNAS